MSEQDVKNYARRLAELPSAWQWWRLQQIKAVSIDVYPDKEARMIVIDDFLLDLWGRVQPGAR